MWMYICVIVRLCFAQPLIYLTVNLPVAESALGTIWRVAGRASVYVMTLVIVLEDTRSESLISSRRL